MLKFWRFLKVNKQMVNLTLASPIHRLRSAFEELTQMLKSEKDLEEKDEYLKAKAVLEEAKLQLV